MSAKNIKNKSLVGDKYYTPNWIIKHFMEHGWSKLGLSAPKTVLDPCCGHGVFKDVMKAYFPDALYTQFDNDVDSVAEHVVDYMSYKTVQKYDLVISNPPYTFAKEFVENALTMSDNVVYLLRINFLGSQKREAFFNKHMPANILTIPNRPSFTGTGTDSIEYAFFHFNNEKNEYAKTYRLPVIP